MIVDTSAIVAILRKVAAARHSADLLATAERPRIPAASYLEAAIGIDGSRNNLTSQQRDVQVEEAELTIEPVTANQARIARRAHREFGKGSGHPARLNFGDCFASALAKETGEPLLFVGNDFPQTDVRAAEDDQ